MDNTKIFRFEKANIRVVTSAPDGMPWFVAKDVCDVLDIANSRQALKRLDDDEKNTVILNDGNRGNPNVSIVNESGLYALVVSSRKPEAKRFRKWITSEVIPSIRKTGRYEEGQASGGYQIPGTYAEALKVAAEQAQLAENQRKQLDAQKPKVLFAEAIETSKTSILVGELAKLLRQNDVLIGPKRLFTWLRENGYLIKRKGTDYNMPTQRSMELGLFEIKETAITHNDGHIHISKTPKVRGKGQRYFINKFLNQTTSNTGPTVAQVSANTN